MDWIHKMNYLSSYELLPVLDVQPILLRRCYLPLLAIEKRACLMKCE